MWDAAKDRVKAEEMVEKPVGEWWGDEDVEEENASLDDEGFPDKGTDGVGVLTRETKEGVGDKQERAEVKPAGDNGVGQDTGMTRNGEEEGDAWTDEAVADL